jgi:hypothetical protein
MIVSRSLAWLDDQVTSNGLGTTDWKLVEHVFQTPVALD